MKVLTYVLLCHLIALSPLFYMAMVTKIIK